MLIHILTEDWVTVTLSIELVSLQLVGGRSGGEAPTNSRAAVIVKQKHHHHDDTKMAGSKARLHVTYCPPAHQLN